MFADLLVPEKLEQRQLRSIHDLQSEIKGERNTWIEWHPYKQVFALGHPHGVILYDLGCQYSLTLTHIKQQDISVIKWHPYIPMIAVGTKKGVCLWRLFYDSEDASILSKTKPLMEFLPQNDVSTLSFSEDGQLLAIGNYRSGKVILYDIATQESAFVGRFGPGSTELLFANDYLYQAISGGGLIIWETFEWTNTHLQTQGEVHSISPLSGTKLVLFGLRGQDVIYQIQMESQAPSKLLGQVGRGLISFKMEPGGKRLVIRDQQGIAFVGVRQEPLPVLEQIQRVQGTQSVRSYDWSRQGKSVLGLGWPDKITFL
ncbi:WD40-repeat-containing domain protein [Gorgonomyces haynaldii]|nr:WD40-repeat-containing domain protein [Gorgonomyces haynaldii]